MFNARKVSYLLPRYLQSDFIAESEWRREFIERIIEHSVRGIGCDYIEFSGIPEVSNSFKLLGEVAQSKRMSIFKKFHSAGCYIPVECDWDSFINSRRHIFRNILRYCEHKLTQRGKLETVRIRNTSDPSQVLVKMLQVVHNSWKLDWIAQKQNRGLISDLLMHCNENGSLDVFFEEIDAVPVAYLFLIHYRRKAYAMFTS